MKNKLRITSLILSIVMLLTALPTGVLAQTFDFHDEDSISLSSYMLELGYNEMALSAEQKEEKELLKSALADFDPDKEGIAYADNRIAFMADSYIEAMEIAACYNAKLVFFEYGYAGAIVDFTDEKAFVDQNGHSHLNVPTSVSDLVELAMDTTNKLPAIYPSYIYSAGDDYSDEVVITDENSDEELIQEVSDDCDYIVNDGLDACDFDEIVEVADDYFPATVSGNESIKKQWFHKYIDTKYAWENGISGNGILVAVIDTGIDNNNPDLKDNIYSYQHNFLADDETLKEIYTDPADASDDFGHGTHCAGAIAAVNNTIGGVGVAYGAKIMALKALNYKGSGGSEIICAAIKAATEKGADIISMSLGGYGIDPLEQKAVKDAIDAGQIVVAAAGNEGENEQGSLYQYPASFDNVLSVGALSPKTKYSEAAIASIRESVKSADKKRYEKRNQEEIDIITNIFASFKKEDGASLALYSNYNDKVSILAPGTAVYSTYILKGDLDKYGRPTYIESTNEYDTGTSMATPITAGVVALAIATDRAEKNKFASLSGVNRQLYMNNLIWQSTDETLYTSTYNGFERSLYGCVNVEKVIENAKAANIQVGMNTDLKPEIEVAKNSDGTYKGGIDSSIVIKNAADFPAGTKFKYTIDGSAPEADNGINYTTSNNLDGIKGEKKIRMVAFYGDMISSEGVLSGKFEIPVSSIELETKEIEILPAKKAVIDLKLYPSDYTKSSISYTSNNKDITVSKKGVIKAGANVQPGTVADITVKDAFSGAEAHVLVTVIAASTQKIEVSDSLKSGMTLYSKNFGDDEALPRTFDLKSSLISANSIGANYFVYKISNKKVAEVRNGVIYAKKSGKTKISIRTNDGSNKQKTITVKVICPVTEADFITSTGYTVYSPEKELSATDIPIGNKKCQVKLKALIDKDCTNKKFKYTVEAGKEKILKVSNSGVIKPGKAAKVGDIVTVTVAAKDGLGYKNSFKVCIFAPVKNLKISVDSSTGIKYVSKVKLADKVKGDTVKVAEYVFRYVEGEDKYLSNNNYIVSYFDAANFCYLEDTYYEDRGALLYITSSDKTLVNPLNTIGDVIVKKAKKGNTTLTLTTRDGSNKKIKVIVPTKE